MALTELKFNSYTINPMSGQLSSGDQGVPVVIVFDGGQSLNNISVIYYYLGKGKGGPALSPGDKEKVKREWNSSKMTQSVKPGRQKSAGSRKAPPKVSTLSNKESVSRSREPYSFDPDDPHAKRFDSLAERMVVDNQGLFGAMGSGAKERFQRRVGKIREGLKIQNIVGGVASAGGRFPGMGKLAAVGTARLFGKSQAEQYRAAGLRGSLAPSGGSSVSPTLGAGAGFTEENKQEGGSSIILLSSIDATTKSILEIMTGKKSDTKSGSKGIMENLLGGPGLGTKIMMGLGILATAGAIMALMKNFESVKEILQNIYDWFTKKDVPPAVRPAAPPGSPITNQHEAAVTASQRAGGGDFPYERGEDGHYRGTNKHAQDNVADLINKSRKGGVISPGMDASEEERLNWVDRQVELVARQRGAMGYFRDNGPSPLLQHVRPEEPTAVPETSGLTGKAAAESYLGKSISDSEYDELIRATHAEAGSRSDPNEMAMIMGSILNRARTHEGGIHGALTQPFQFQAVTGSKGNDFQPSQQYINGPGESRLSTIEDAAISKLHMVPQEQKDFSAASAAAYGEGTNIGYRDNIIAGGGTLYGGTVFRSSGLDVSSQQRNEGAMLAADTNAIGSSRGGNQIAINAPNNSTSINQVAGKGREIYIPDASNRDLEDHSISG